MFIRAVQHNSGLDAFRAEVREFCEREMPPEVRRKQARGQHLERHEYDVRWLTRTKKRNAPRHLNQQDQARFQKSRDYMVRVDDQLMCKNMRCRKRFDIPSSQTVVFI